MKHSASIQRLAGLAAPALALVAGCSDYDDDDDSYGHGLPHYGETEPNDSVAQADDFGLLFPLEHFVIEGHVDVEGSSIDPFDGFAFQAADPLFVAFTLFVHDHNADVRVGLYDVLIQQTVAYWYQDDGIVYGELDVFEGGNEFHLFVEPLFGDTSYELEIESFHLYSAQATAPLAAAPDVRLALAPRASAPLDAAERQAAARYGPPSAARPSADEPAPIAGAAWWIAIDPEGETKARGSILFTAGGSWMGMTGDALVD